MVASIPNAVKVRVYVDLDMVAGGVGATATGVNQANNPGFGQAATPGIVGMGQTLHLQAAEQVLGAGGSITLAEIQAALVAIANDLAGASGTPIITAAILAQINGWATGSP